MSSNSVKPQSSSSPSQPENVKTVGHEIDHKVKQQNTAVRHEDGNVPVDSTWTKVVNDRPARPRRTDLAARKGENKSSSHLLGQRGIFPSSRPAVLSKSDFFKAKLAKERKSEKDFSTLQAQVTALTGTLESLMQLIKQGNLGSIPTPKLGGSPVRRFNVESPSRVTPKVSFAEVLSRTPSPIKSSSSSARSSPSGDSATSTPKESPVTTPNTALTSFTPAKVVPASTEKGSATPSPSTPSTPAADMSTPTPSTPAADAESKSTLSTPAADKESTPTPSASTSAKRSTTSPSASASAKKSTTGPVYTPTPSAPAAGKKSSTTPPPSPPSAASKPKKGAKASTRSPSSPFSSEDSSGPVSTPDRKARRRARRLEIKAERKNKALTASYQLVKTVTDKFRKLGTSNYDPWRREWEREFKTLGYNKRFMNVEGPELDLKAESTSETVDRKNAAQMVMKTVDVAEHEPWLRDTDPENPQAIFRRLHLKFRGSNTDAVSNALQSQLLVTSMKSSRLDVIAYATSIIEGLRKLKEMGTPMDEKKAITIYLLGLNKAFDTIRDVIEKLISKDKPTAPKTMADARKMVEDWAVKLKERGLLTFKDTSGGDPKSTVHTFLGEVKKNTSEACRAWLKWGKCKNNSLGKCLYQHDVKKKGINAPSPAVLSGAARGAVAGTGKIRDFTNMTCELCNVKGHSKNWALCPKRAQSNGATNVMNFRTAFPTPATAGGSSSQTPSILSISDNMTPEVRAMHEYNGKLLNILNVLATNATRPIGALSAGAPLLDTAAIMQAFQTSSLGH